MSDKFCKCAKPDVAGGNFDCAGVYRCGSCGLRLTADRASGREIARLKIANGLELHGWNGHMKAVRLTCNGGVAELALDCAETDALIVALQLARIELWPDAPSVVASDAELDKRHGLAAELRSYAKSMEKIGHGAAADRRAQHGRGRRHIIANRRSDPVKHGWQYAVPWGEGVWARCRRETIDRRNELTRGGSVEGERRTAAAVRQDRVDQGPVYQSHERNGIYWRTDRRAPAPMSRAVRDADHIGENLAAGSALDAIGLRYGVKRKRLVPNNYDSGAHPETDAELRERVCAAIGDTLDALRAGLNAGLSVGNIELRRRVERLTWPM